MIAIEGKNLGGALKVFINNQELTFNTTMNTDHSIIVSIPTEEKGFKLSAFEDVPDEIRVETRGGVATYEFKVTAPGPQLQRIQAEYPRETGDEILLHGLNLVDIEDAYFSDVTVEELAESESKEIGGNHVAISNIEMVLMDHHLASNNSYVTTSILKFAMPEVPYQSGVIVLECAAGTTYIAYYKVPGQPTITSISSDMPQIGEDLIIKGTEFVQVESVKYGDVTLTEDEFEVNEEQTQITVPFAKKPSAGSDAKLTVTTPGGTVSVDRFYDYSTILTTFNKDDAGNFIDATNNGWGPDAQFIDGGDADGAGDGQGPGDDEGARGDQRALAQPAIRAGLVEYPALADSAQMDGEVLVHAHPLGGVGVGGAALDDVVAVGGGEELGGKAFAGHHDGFDGVGQVGDGAAFGEIHDLLLHGEILLLFFRPPVLRIRGVVPFDSHSLARVRGVRVYRG
jgi:hypothetical protein